ncbi:GDSL esterase/lipase At2g31550 [Ricinus communis]|uniref:Zinc finger protein, putative n=1 Tax=Ricinus communis TaxID=3988 RepID=B9RM21_RICCO|nr:GDSL esterase/lipase At2g31550 [Ricinus communis]EEF47344.1 zinc finger protein, putative [Ricinus communis]|eukprot:XP_002514790.1 GDSL esterase/lipase At2g31550 [Ricinus communis]
MAGSTFFLLVTFIFYSSCCIDFAAPATNPLPKFSALFCFGDSILDTGNNNYIKALFKSDYRPYGQDFPNGIPTGRFSNGRLIPDMLASVLEIKDTLPPFLQPNLSNEDLITGVNFASAGSGFDAKTNALTNAISFSRQIDLFKDYVARLKGVVGEEKAMQIINDAVIVVTGATDDYVFNIFDFPTRRFEFTPRQYGDFLLNNLQNITKELYSLGLRAMLVLGLPPVGFLPFQTSIRLANPFALRYSLEEQNEISADYNQKLIGTLSQLQQTLPGSKIVYTDVYEIIEDMVTSPQKYGFVETKDVCCGSGLLEQNPSCDPFTPPCQQPSKFLFWDRIHPTLAAYHYIFNSLVQNVLPKFL